MEDIQLRPAADTCRICGGELYGGGLCRVLNGFRVHPDCLLYGLTQQIPAGIAAEGALCDFCGVSIEAGTEAFLPPGQALHTDCLEAWSSLICPFEEV